MTICTERFEPRINVVLAFLQQQNTSMKEKNISNILIWFNQRSIPNWNDIHSLHFPPESEHDLFDPLWPMQLWLVIKLSRYHQPTLWHVNYFGIRATTWKIDIKWWDWEDPPGPHPCFFFILFICFNILNSFIYLIEAAASPPPLTIYCGP